jgi:hypothetical protein
MATPRRTLSLEAFERRQMMTVTVAELELNDTHATATAFEISATEPVLLEGISQGSQDKDFFTFTAGADAVLSAVVTSPSGILPSLEIETAQGQDVLETEPNDGVNAAATRIDAGIKYFVRVRASDDAAADYSVALSLGDRLPGDANDDGATDLSDLNDVRNNFGSEGVGDVNDDGSVDLSDLNDVRNNFGAELEQPVPGGIVAEVEPNSAKSSATEFFVAPLSEATLTGVSQNAEDRDFFTFVAPASGALFVTVRSSNGNVPAVEMENSASIQILETEPNDGIDNASGVVVEGETYFIRVRSKNENAADYAVTVSFEGFAVEEPGPEPANALAETEGNDTKSQANAFSLGSDKLIELTGTSTSSDDKDYFRFVAPLDGTLYVAVRSTNGNDAAVEMEDSASNAILETEPHDGVNQASGAVVAGQVYFLRARSTNDDPAAYVVTVSYEPQDDGGPEPGGEPGNLVVEAEPNNDKDLAKAFDLGSDNYVQLTGVSASHDDKDFFKFTPSVSGTLTATVASLSGPLADLEIEYQQDNQVLEIEPQNGTTSATGQVTAGVTYFVRLRGHDPYYGVGAPSEYLVTLELTPTAPALQSAPAVPGKSIDAFDAIFASATNFAPNKVFKSRWLK